MVTHEYMILLIILSSVLHIVLEVTLQNSQDQQRILSERSANWIKNSFVTLKVEIRFKYIPSYEIHFHTFFRHDRCIANDDEIQQLRKKAGELKEKLDEAESAIVELGQVNQSLQVLRIRTNSSCN